MPKCIIMVGAPGCGKSTYSKKNFKLYERINLDTLKTRNREKHFILDCAMKDLDMVIDNTNIDVATRQRYFILLGAFEYEFHAVLFDISYEENIRRNDGRDDIHIPHHVIRSYRKKLEKPTINEGFLTVTIVKEHE